MSNTVKVTGFSSSTTEAQLQNFFSFCGNIKSIDLHEEAALVHFEQAEAVNTALILSGGVLDGASLDVTTEGAPSSKQEPETHGTGGQPEQHEKPKAAIAAEYLARGYVLGDHVLQRAIKIDSEQGISKRFLEYFHSMDSAIGERALGADQKISSKVQETVKQATEQARAMDEQKGYSKLATDYYTKAISSPFGSKVLEFYTTTSKQVQDIHEEARRIAESHKATHTAQSAAKE